LTSNSYTRSSADADKLARTTVFSLLFIYFLPNYMHVPQRDSARKRLMNAVIGNVQEKCKFAIIASVISWTWPL